ncbi:MAG: hypothetical protein JXD23_05085 [Spirochaetales bacterium]|nr:hypothetical protein [Spirochaetales bacterium]
MKPKTGRKIIIFLLLINPALALADLDPAARLEPLPIARRLSSGGGGVAPGDFADAALVFSGVSENDFARSRGSLAAVTETVKKHFADRPVDRSLADDLLSFLHEKYLVRYAATVTGLDRILDAGLFNCVSSSVFFLIAADALGIPASGVRTSDHAFVKVSVDGASFDVETTSRYGFDPGRRRDFLDEFGRTTGFVYTPPTNYADRTNIGRTEILSLILINRVSTLVGEKDFTGAIGVGVDLFELVKNEETMNILLGVFSESARYALDAGRFEAGYTILGRAGALYGDFDRLRTLKASFAREWANRLVEKKAFAEAEAAARRAYAEGALPPDDFRAVILFRYLREAEAVAADPGRGPAGALAVINAARKELGDDPELLKGETIYAHNLVLALAGKGAFDEAESTLDEFVTARKIDKADYLALLVYCTQRRASVAAVEKGDEEALAVVEAGLAKTNRAQALLKSAGVYSYNLCLKLIQSGSFAAAASFLTGERAAAYLSAQTRGELALYLYTSRSEAAKKTNDFSEAVAAIEEGLAALGPKPELLRSYEVLVHNRMIEFYNEKDYDRAEETIASGLKVYPSSALLKDDLRKIRKMKE